MSTHQCYLLTMPPPKIYPRSGRPSPPKPATSPHKYHPLQAHYLTPTHTMQPSTRYSSNLHQDPPPSAPISPPPPTQNHITHTKVSTTICTHQKNTSTKICQKTNTELSINLPPRKHYCRSTPFHTFQLQHHLCQKHTKMQARHTKDANTQTHPPHIDLHPTHPTTNLPHPTTQTKPQYTHPNHLRSQHLTLTPKKPKTSKPPYNIFRPQTKNTEIQLPFTQPAPTRQLTILKEQNRRPAIAPHPPAQIPPPSSQILTPPSSSTPFSPSTLPSPPTLQSTMATTKST